MQRKNLRSIKTKLLLLLGLSATIAISISSIAIFIYTYVAYEEQAKSSLFNTASILSKNLSASVEFDDTQSANTLLNTLQANKSIEGAFVFNKQKRLFATYIRNKENSSQQLREIKKIYNKQKEKHPFTSINKKYVFANVAIISDGEYLGNLSLISNTNALYHTIYRQLIISILAFFFALLIVILLALKLQKNFTHPILTLKKEMNNIMNHGHFSPLANNNDDEFYTLFNGFNSMMHQITQQTSELEEQKKFVQSVLDAQQQLIVITDSSGMIDANNAFFTFFHVNSVEDFKEKYNAHCICDRFDKNASSEYLKKVTNKIYWTDYVLAHTQHTQKVKIIQDNSEYIFSVSVANITKNSTKLAVFVDITEMEKTKLELEVTNKHTKDSIEYASLIQGALLPDNNKFRNYFSDYFAIWHPKDTIGGDIYLFEDLRNEDECLLMVIDCTGHGVPGAFVTMLVKAIERQITAKIINSDEKVSPANILSIFNKSMKHLLKQEDVTSISNAGFDGAILYYNKKENIIRYAGAEIPLFYIEDEEIKVIKGDRYSVGYKKCDINYKYKEHTIKLKKGMQFYISTDGYFDQNGGSKGFPFGKKRFKEIIKEYHNESMPDQQEVFLGRLSEYQDEEETNDDITLIGFKI